MTMQNPLITAAILSIAIGTGSYIVSWTKVSDPLRAWVSRQAHRGFPFNWLSAGLVCPFCVGVWLSMAATLLYHPLLVHLSGTPNWTAWLLDRLVTALTISGAAMASVRLVGSALGRYASPAPVWAVPSGNGASHHANGDEARMAQRQA